MDPYLEDPDLWPDVHARLIAAVAELLTPGLRPRYVARVEQRTFLFDPADPSDELYLVPDARVVEVRSPQPRPLSGGVGALVAESHTIATPLDVTGMVVKAAVQRFLEIRDRADRHVVTVIELVSPSNKIEGSAGRRAFLRKREEVGSSDASWLEIDLHRRGARTVSFPRMVRSAYLAYADRTTTADRKQLAWPIGLRDRLPRLEVPLRPGDTDVALDLQTALDVVYQRAAYDLDVDYGSPADPALTGDDEQWADGLLREKGLR